MVETFSNILKVCLLENFVKKVLQKKNNTLFDNLRILQEQMKH